MNFRSLILAGLLSVGLMSQVLAAGLYTNGLPASPTPYTGVETIPDDTNLTQGLNPATAKIPLSAIMNDAQYTAATNTAAFTATTAQLTGKSFVVLDLTGTLGASGALTTPTALQLIAAYPLISSGGYVLRVIARTASNTWTVTGGTGVTVTGGAITAGNAVDYFVTSPTATTVTVTEIGTMTK